MCSSLTLWLTLWRLQQQPWSSMHHSQQSPVVAQHLAALGPGIHLVLGRSLHPAYTDTDDDDALLSLPRSACLHALPPALSHHPRGAGP